MRNSQHINAQQVINKLYFNRMARDAGHQRHTSIFLPSLPLEVVQFNEQ